MVGGLLHLQLGHATVRAEILQVFKPFTLSCEMMFRVQNYAELPPVAVLKTYDRHFAAQLRRDNRSSQAYASLLQYQGRHIPTLYGSVRVHGSGSFNEYADVQGILIEYIDGFCLTELSIFCPKDQGQSVGEDAIHIVHCLNSAGILN